MKLTLFLTLFFTPIMAAQESKLSISQGFKWSIYVCRNENVIFSRFWVIRINLKRRLMLLEPYDHKWGDKIAD